MRTSLVLAGLLISSTASLVQADSDVAPSSRTDRRDHSRIGATAGLLTPVGEAGLEYTYAAHRNVEVGFGAGLGHLGVGTPTPQASIMPRLRTRRGPVSLSIGTGLSGGPYTNLGIRDGADVIHHQSTTALWANVEAGIQVSSRRGPFARFALGAGKVIAHSKIEADSMTYTTNLHDDALPFAALTVGTSL
jgi:hypothetical protein